MFSEIQTLAIYFNAVVADKRARARDDEAGASDLITMVIMAALFAAAAIAIATIIITKFTGKANSIPTG